VSVVATVPTEALDRTWSPVLDGVRAAELDCVQANLAAVADRWHGAGAHLALGAAPRFAPVFPPDGPPTVEPSVETRLAEAERLLGLVVAERHDGLDGPALRALATGHEALYVVGDAFTMTWVPYAGQRHMGHSFLLTAVDDRCTVVDAYHNDTPWGSARPGVWRLPVAELDAAATEVTALVLTAGPPSAPDRDTALVEAARAWSDTAVDRYVAAVREHAEAGWDNLVLDVWLRARSCRLHASWAAAAGVEGAERVAAQAEAWPVLASQTYVAMRRARRGGGMPAGLVDRLHELLRADAALARALAGPAVRATVVAELAAVLGLDPAAVGTADVLRDLPNFNSFRLVDVIERVETRLGVELDPDDLATGDLRDPAALGRLFERAVGAP
jgi:acyl carrier protein